MVFCYRPFLLFFLAICILRKESLKGHGQQFHQYQQNILRHMTLEIQAMAWYRHKMCDGFIWWMSDSQDVIVVLVVRHLLLTCHYLKNVHLHSAYCSSESRRWQTLKHWIILFIPPRYSIKMADLVVDSFLRLTLFYSHKIFHYIHRD